MKFWDLFKKRSSAKNKLTAEEAYKIYLPGGFEFLITGDLEINPEQADELLMPSSYEVTKTIRGGCPYFKVGDDEFCYSSEMPGLQMTFNKEATFEKAKQIADEIIAKLRAAGQPAELVVLDSSKVYRFD